MEQFFQKKSKNFFKILTIRIDGFFTMLSLNYFAQQFKEYKSIISKFQPDSCSHCGEIDFFHIIIFVRYLI